MTAYAGQAHIIGAGVGIGRAGAAIRVERVRRTVYRGAITGLLRIAFVGGCAAHGT